MVLASSGKQVLKRGKEDPRADEEAGKFGAACQQNPIDLKSSKESMMYPKNIWVPAHSKPASAVIQDPKKVRTRD